MNQPPGKSHLTALDILLELRCWLAEQHRDAGRARHRGSPA